MRTSLGLDVFRQTERAERFRPQSNGGVTQQAANSRLRKLRQSVHEWLPHTRRDLSLLEINCKHATPKVEHFCDVLLQTIVLRDHDEVETTINKRYFGCVVYCTCHFAAFLHESVFRTCT